MSLFAKCGVSLFLLLILPAVSAASTEFSRTQVLFGNVPVTITIRASAEKREKAFAAMTGAFETARAIGDEVSELVPTSDVSRLNHAGVEGVKVGRHLLRILQRARKISELTDGAFDVTFASKKKGVSYRDIEIDAAKSRVRFRRAGVRIGVSGIAKGYIVDRMGDLLRKRGFRSFLINAAGDILAKGTWEVGIADPRSRTREALCTVTLKDRAISTSGTYERGKHILDPRTKKVVSHFAGVSVIADRSWMTDALGTAFFVGRQRDVEQWIKNFEGVSAIVIGRDGCSIFPSASWHSFPSSCDAGGSRW